MSTSLIRSAFSFSISALRLAAFTPEAPLPLPPVGVFACAGDEDIDGDADGVADAARTKPWKMLPRTEFGRVSDGR